MDDIHFGLRKHKCQFKIKAQIDPFTFKTRATKKEVDILLKEMKYKSSFSQPYDPLGMVSKIWSEKNSAPYVHILKPEFELFPNIEEWEEKTLQ